MLHQVDKYAILANCIERWFSNTARDFPWRVQDTPWGRLVCEFMSQQTQIERVADRWIQMMERFPTPQEMAKSDEQDVLSLWQGLGYYRRANNLKATAEMIVDVFDGEVPCDIQDLLKLPGVGKYTAGAIASIAFGHRVPLVDGNVHRVQCRLFDHRDESTPGKWTWDEASQFVHACTNPKVCNEGLMELGATVCTPKSPRCCHCPLKSHCLSYKNNSQSEVPPPKKQTPKKHLHHYAVVLENGNELAFEQRSNKGLWAGMWQVPTIESSIELSTSEVAKELDISQELKSIGSFTHVLTHRTIFFKVFCCKSEKECRFNWCSGETIDELPLASAQRKVLAVHCNA